MLFLSTVIQIGVADVSGALMLLKLLLPLIDFFDEAVELLRRVFIVFAELTVHCIVRLINPFCPVLALADLTKLL